MWYERWFGKEYKALYPHRDQDQADHQARFLARAAGAQPDWRILDLGCGAGRHLRAFRRLPSSRIVGVDLSRVLLRDARLAGPVAQADMRQLPFADSTFDLVGCFFTSFGYFVTFEEDVAALQEFLRVLKPGGMLFLDLNNPEHVLRHLIPRDHSVIQGNTVEVTRTVEEDVVVKSIRIQSPDKSEVRYEERVRLFPLARLQPVFTALNLTVVKIFGDECGQAFAPATSPRMGLLLRRNP